jgi:hypothetical protein
MASSRNGKSLESSKEDEDVHQSTERTSNPRKQQRMLRQMQQQRQEEDTQMNTLKDLHHDALGDLRNSYLRTLGTIIVAGLAILLYVSPKHFFFWKTGPQLPNRNLVLLYPEGVTVKRHLKRFFRNYALLTQENAQARTWLQHAHAVRNVATDRGAEFRKSQSIHLHAIEIKEDFEAQLPTDVQKDRVCGKGFGQAYANFGSVSAELRQRARHDLIVYCLLAWGTHDGYIHWNDTNNRTTTKIQASLTRGLQGLAGKYVDEDRIHTSVLLLPILSQDEIDQLQKGGSQVEVQPSTQLPVPALAFLVRMGQQLQSGDIEHMTVETYVRKLETFLYRIIVTERERWVLLDVVCSPQTRARFDGEYRRIATTCSRKETTESKEKDDEEDCCSYYDPTMKPFVKRRKRDDDEDD